MRNLRIVVVNGVMSLFLSACGGSAAGQDVSPLSAELFDRDADWEVDSFCRVNGKSYCLGHDEYNRTIALFVEDGVLAEDPTLRCEAVADGESNNFWVTVAGRRVQVDFANSSSIGKMMSMGKVLPVFSRMQKALKPAWENASYHFSVDVPSASAAHSEAIRAWALSLIDESVTSQGGDDTLESVLESVAENYFEAVAADWEDEMEYMPFGIRRILDLRARIANGRFVTYQRYTYEYGGGAHGYYTEELVSYDPVNDESIDWNYLFAPQNREQVMELFYGVVEQDEKFREWVGVESREDVMKRFSRMPRPALGEDGVVFSFQPYEIGAYAAGTFHFVLPYELVMPLLTDRAKWCLAP